MRPLERAGCVLLSAGPQKLETENHDFWGLSGSNDAVLSVLGAIRLPDGTGKPTPSSVDPREGEIRTPGATSLSAAKYHGSGLQVAVSPIQGGSVNSKVDLRIKN